MRLALVHCAKVGLVCLPAAWIHCFVLDASDPMPIMIALPVLMMGIQDGFLHCTQLAVVFLLVYPRGWQLSQMDCLVHVQDCCQASCVGAESADKCTPGVIVIKCKPASNQGQWISQSSMRALYSAP